jgi:hypothetical protein
MHYMTRRTHQIQKQKFTVMCPKVLFVESIPIPPRMKNSVLMFHAPDAPECIMSPTDPTRFENISSP